MFDAGGGRAVRAAKGATGGWFPIVAHTALFEADGVLLSWLYHMPEHDGQIPVS